MLHRYLMSSALKCRETSPALQSNNENSPSPKNPKCEEINLLSNRQLKLFNDETHAGKEVLPKLLLERTDSAAAVVVPVPAWAAAGWSSSPVGPEVGIHGSGNEFTWKIWP